MASLRTSLEQLGTKCRRHSLWLWPEPQSQTPQMTPTLSLPPPLCEVTPDPCLAVRTPTSIFPELPSGKGFRNHECDKGHGQRGMTQGRAFKFPMASALVCSRIFFHLLQKQSACVIRCQHRHVPTESTKNASKHARVCMG